MMLPYAELFGLRKLAVRGTLWDAPAGIAYRATKLAGPGRQRILRLVRSAIRRRQAKPAPHRRQRAGLVRPQQTLSLKFMFAGPDKELDERLRASAELKLE